MKIDPLGADGGYDRIGVSLVIIGLIFAAVALTM